LGLAFQTIRRKNVSRKSNNGRMDYSNNQKEHKRNSYGFGRIIRRKRLKKALQKLEDFKEKHYYNLPNLDLSAHKATLEQQKVLVKTYSEKMVKDLLLNHDLLKVTSVPTQAAKFIERNYPYPEELAFRSLQTAFKTLSCLGFFEKSKNND
jgi:hypothetical protein